MEITNCKDCLYYEPTGEECRRFSPTNVDGESYYGIWPRVDPDSGWCGQFDEDGERIEFIPE